MFEKLVESKSEDAGFKNRKRYFMVSSVVVGILFSVAVVIGIFAADFDLGSDRLELTELTLATEVDSVEPEPPQPQRAASSLSQSQIPIRTAIIQRIDEPPVSAPQNISTSPNTAMSRPLGDFTVGRTDTGISEGPPREIGTGSEPHGSQASTKAVEEPQPLPVPPPIINPDPSKPRAIKSEGVINGKATHLPAPAYPVLAKSTGVAGTVNVQVMIDESGKIVSAKAVSGHALLRPSAERAAWGAKFGVTYLSRVPVKVTGVIVYNFKR